MGWVLARPSLTLLEVAWRWLFGAPLGVVCWLESQKILAAVPPESAGLTSIDFTNPWTAVIKLAAAWQYYQPPVVHVLAWLAPAAALAWIVISGLGRAIVLKRMEPQLPLRPLAMVFLQAAWLVVLAITCWAWWTSINWAAQTHIDVTGDPDLIGYTMWAIFLSLGYFTLWALVSWAVTMAPMLMLLEKRSALSALVASFRLGKVFTSKLVEINLVMGIVKLMLIVVAMVFSSVLLPFSEEVGAGTLHLEWIVVAIFYFIASDYFQVVRLKGFIEFWHTYRGDQKIFM